MWVKCKYSNPGGTIEYTKLVNFGGDSVMFNLEFMWHHQKLFH